MLHILVKHIQSQNPSSVQKQRGFFAQKILDIFHTHSLKQLRTSGWSQLSDQKLVVLFKSIQMGLIPTQEVRSALWEYSHLHASQEISDLLSAESMLEYHRTKTMPQIDISPSPYGRIFTNYLPTIYGKARHALEQKGIFSRYYRAETPEEQERRKESMKKALFRGTRHTCTQLPEEEKKILIKIYFHTHLLSRVIGKMEILEDE